MTDNDAPFSPLNRPPPLPISFPPGPGATQPVRRVLPPPLPLVEALSPPFQGEATSNEQDPAEFPVGWLVIVAGPGRGRFLVLHAGMNHLGRSGVSRLQLNFGDEGISLQAHTILTYDPRGKRFYVQPGNDPTKLTYLAEGTELKPLLTPTEILGGEIFVLGRTHLKFAPFCGANFNWESTPSPFSQD